MTIRKEDLNGELLVLLAKEEIAEKLKAAKNQEECYNIIKPHLPGMSMEEFLTSTELIDTFVKENTEGGGTLALDELDEVAGGSTISDVGTILCGVGAVAGAVITIT